MSLYSSVAAVHKFIRIFLIRKSVAVAPSAFGAEARSRDVQRTVEFEAIGERRNVRVLLLQLLHRRIQFIPGGRNCDVMLFENIRAHDQRIVRPHRFMEAREHIIFLSSWRSPSSSLSMSHFSILSLKFGIRSI